MCTNIKELFINSMTVNDLHSHKNVQRQQTYVRSKILQTNNVVVVADFHCDGAFSVGGLLLLIFSVGQCHQ